MSKMEQLDLIEVSRYPRNRVQLLLDIAEKQDLNIELVEGCVEPGCDDKPMALANWNDIRTYDKKTKKYVSRNITPGRLVVLFEKLGYAVGWDDEWTACNDCGKVVRCEPDSYAWRPYYWQNEHEIVCGDCVKATPQDYLDFLSGNSEHCLMFDIDLSEYGYELHSDDYSSGWYGQEDDPKEIAKQLRGKGVRNFIFKLDGKGQFSINFSVWVKENK